MPIKSRWSTDIPNITLPSYVFGTPWEPLPDTPLLMDARSPEKHYLTAQSYRLWCQRFAVGLRRAGLKKGDRVLLFSGNTIFFPVVIVGTIMAGGIFTGANPTYVPRELAYQLKDSGAKFLLTSEASVETSLEAAKINGFPLEQIFLFDDGIATFEGTGQDQGKLRHWSKLLADEEAGRWFQWAELSPQELKTTTVTLNYSSGTTGVPKGVEITHRNYVSNAVQIEFQTRLDPEFDEKNERAKLLCFLPLYHAMAQTIFGINCLKQRIPCYMMGKFDFVQMLEYTQKYRITFLILVPPVVVAMAKHPITKNYDLSSVENIGSGAAPLGREVCVELEKLWPEGTMNVKQGWGMTEVTCSAMGWHPLDHSDSFSVGELNANCEAMIVDENGKEITKRGERGEIWIKAPNVMKGYWNKPDATKETMTPDGWLKTGDVAYVDEHNRFYIVDRKKELIKVKGNQVAPAELEAVLLDFDPIADAAVIGVSKGGDEYPRAYIVLKEGSKCTEDDIQNYMNKLVTRHKRLTGGVRFVDAIPKNPSGKILRKLLRDQAHEEQKGEKARL